MLKLFSGGTYNLIVEPVPEVLLLLFALVWLVPTMLGEKVRAGDPDALELGALFVTVSALMPVALGRADPVHVLSNGLGVFLLSFVAIRRYSRRAQRVWAVLVTAVMLHGMIIINWELRNEVRSALFRAVLNHQKAPGVRNAIGLVVKVRPGAAGRFMEVAASSFDVQSLRALVGSSQVATPIAVSPDVEEALRREGLYRPDFYYYMADVLDEHAEKRKIEELNKSQWALIPAQPYRFTELQSQANALLGFSLPYKARRSGYVIGEQLSEDLRRNWTVAGNVSGYLVYKKSKNNATE